jgi:hypothetical protein
MSKKEVREKAGAFEKHIGIKLTKFFLFFLVFLFLINFSYSGTTHGVLGKVLDACDGTKADGANVAFYIENRPNEILYDVVGPSGNSGSSNWYFVDVGNFPTPWRPGEKLIIGIYKDKTHYANTSVILTNSGFDIAPTVRLSGGVCPSNRPPKIIDYYPKENLSINKPIEFWVYAIDEDNDTLFVEWYVDNNLAKQTQGDQPINASFLFNYGIGMHIVSVVVSDGSLTDSLVWQINVINNPPEINCTPPPGNIETNTSLTFFAYAKDIDNDQLTLFWLVDDLLKKTKQGIGEVNDSFEFSSNEGNYVIEVIASDGLNNKSCVWNVRLLNATCVDYWKCGNWSECDEYGRRYRECYKINPECESNVNQPSMQMYDPSCFVNCSFRWVCGNWSECKAEYDLEKLIEKEKPYYYVQGKMYLECYDLNNCTKLKRIEIRNCTLKVPVKIEVKKECEVAFIYIIDLNTNKTLAKVKRPFGFTGVDVYIWPSEKEKYCWYCFDGIKDFDEVAVDCGGPNCPPCSLKEFLPIKKDILKIIVLILFILTFILFIISKIKELRENINPVMIFEKVVK